MTPRQPSPPLRAQAQSLAQSMPALLLRAQRLQANLRAGNHGRRQAGHGDEFWQYRSAMTGDQISQIDWRRSARSQALFVRENEWQSPQTVRLHIDQGASMDFSTCGNGETKGARAMLLGLAIASLLSRGGERFALLRDSDLPKTGPAQLSDFAAKLATPIDPSEFDLPPTDTLGRGGQVILLSDFLSPWDHLEPRLEMIAIHQADTVLLQILDPAEQSFPYQGRVKFESMRGSMKYDAHSAQDLRAPYLTRLRERQEHLRDLAARYSWHYQSHITEHSAQSALLWLYQAMSK